MASGGQTFPPQKQETQPGKEHAMDPTPHHSSQDYKPANKLRVIHLLHFLSSKCNYVLLWPLVSKLAGFNILQITSLILFRLLISHTF